MGRSSARTFTSRTSFTKLKLKSVSPRVTSASSEVVADAIRHAHDVFKSGIWSRASAHQRSLTLSRIARKLEDRMSDFVQMESMQTGRAIREMSAQVGRLPEWL